MAIIVEDYRTRADGVKLHRIYSTYGLKIRKIGTDEIYNQAIDVEGAPFTYVETDQKIEVEDGFQ